jgi:hypothetical protein
MAQKDKQKQRSKKERTDWPHTDIEAARASLEVLTGVEPWELGVSPEELKDFKRKCYEIVANSVNAIYKELSL